MSRQIGQLRGINLTKDDIIQTIAKDEPFKQDKTYLINFYVVLKDLNLDTTLYIKLKSDSNISRIKTIFIPKNSSSNQVNMSIITTPNNIYNDFIIESNNDNIVSYDIENKNILINLIDTKIPEANSLLKIGVQGPPGFLMAINGEQIKISKSGIYELGEIFEINKFSIAETSDVFLLDYVYEKEE